MGDEAQEVAGLLHRVGAVGDHHGVHVFLCQHFVQTLGELEPDLVVHVLTADVDHLLAGDVRQIAQVGNGLDEIFHLEAAGLVARVLAFSLRPGDGAAGCQDHHVRLCGPARAGPQHQRCEQRST